MSTAYVCEYSTGTQGCCWIPMLCWVDDMKAHVTIACVICAHLRCYTYLCTHVAPFVYANTFTDDCHWLRQELAGIKWGHMRHNNMSLKLNSIELYEIWMVSRTHARIEPWSGITSVFIRQKKEMFVGNEMAQNEKRVLFPFEFFALSSLMLIAHCSLHNSKENVFEL